MASPLVLFGGKLSRLFGRGDRAPHLRFGGRLGAGARLVQDHAFERIAFLEPCLGFERAVGVSVARLPALTERAAE